MPDFRMPLSGAVTQSINPWSWTFGDGARFGLVNINMGQSAAPELEQRILDDVGSYGRQIGRIGEALEVLLDHVKLNEKERLAVQDFRLQMAQVNRLKAQHGGRRAA